MEGEHNPRYAHLFGDLPAARGYRAAYGRLAGAECTEDDVVELVEAVADVQRERRARMRPLMAQRFAALLGMSIDEFEDKYGETV